MIFFLSKFFSTENNTYPSQFIESPLLNFRVFRDKVEYYFIAIFSILPGYNELVLLLRKLK